MIAIRPAHRPDLSMPVIAIRPRYVPPIVGRHAPKVAPASMMTRVGKMSEAGACAFEDQPPRCAGDRPDGKMTSFGLAWLAGSLASGGVIGSFLFGHGLAGLAVGGVVGAATVLPASGTFLGLRTTYCCRDENGKWVWREEGST